MARYKWLTLIFVLVVGTLDAQDRYMVFFKDKADSPYSIESPEEFLSQRSLDRREKNGVIPNEQDLPVNPAYIQSLAETEGVEVYFRSKWMNAVLVEMSPTFENAVLNLEFVESIQFVAPGNRLTNEKLPIEIAENFTIPASTNLSTDTQLNMLGVDRLHNDGYTGTGILLAVFDGGFLGVNQRAVFADIHTENRILAEYDYVSNSGNPYQYDAHGTSVLSCIAGNYGSEFVGTAPDVSLILAVTEEVYRPNGSTPSEYRVEEYNWLFAAEMADSAGVDIISSSLGYSYFDDSSMDYVYADMDGETSVIVKAANMVSDRGVLVVTSAGNEGDDPWYYVSSPADGPNVMAVGAVDAQSNKSLFSSFGPSSDNRIKPDVAAMGKSTVLVRSNGNISIGDGTSYSAPLIAGFAASLWQANLELTRAEIFDLIKNSGNQATNPDNELGYGIPNYLVILGEPLSTANNPIFEVYPIPTRYEVTIKTTKPLLTEYSVIDIEGRLQLGGTLNEPLNQVSLSKLPAGIYFLQLKSGGFSETIKLLKN